jgi:hypothetical protein
MKFIQSFNGFLNEKAEKDFEDKIKGHGYFKGISTSTARKKVAQMKDQADKPDDDPSAYQELPGDTKGKKLLKPSKHTKAYADLYGDEENEGLIFQESVMGDLHYMMGAAKNVKQFQKMFYDEYGDRIKPSKETDEWLKDLYEDGLGESVNEEQKQSTDRSPIDDSAIETGLENKSKETGVPIGILRAVMRRGMAAWKSGHRPGAGQQQWGYARVNSFLTKGDGTWGKADKDLAKEVRDGGHDKKLKSA